ncbi:Com family DNA-binding transcriptional regulator [Pseudomonas sp. Hg5Tf]|uniref:Com family DNA-binding transcriptional regulator n=1 Tax=Pseudomonas sp. Hg7Tf TaxID=3236988 RepID=A0AB39I8E5_9PSED|nr:Com family DNA-binding transcriptional regulator [Pseudomonas sp. Hg5Tf]MDH2558391.1 Com family DNA-binding transcriptional regulator [Pseudomonas sp. Hg5Tf]
MLEECRCGNCKRLLARVGEFTELQIKCSRCGTLNHVKASSLERSPMSELRAATAAQHVIRSLPHIEANI